MKEEKIDYTCISMIFILCITMILLTFSLLEEKEKSKNIEKIVYYTAEQLQATNKELLKLDEELVKIENELYSLKELQRMMKELR